MSNKMSALPLPPSTPTAPRNLPLDEGGRGGAAWDRRVGAGVMSTRANRQATGACNAAATAYARHGHLYGWVTVRPVTEGLGQGLRRRRLQMRAAPPQRRLPGKSAWWCAEVTQRRPRVHFRTDARAARFETRSFRPLGLYQAIVP
eukprot:365723-Chlamydomonas_euryale.AAC.5